MAKKRKRKIVNDIEFIGIDNFSGKKRLPISQAVVAGDFLYTWGHGVVFDPKNPEPGIRKEFEHLRELLAEKGLTFRHVVKTTVLLSRGEFFWIYTKIYQEYFKKPYPARTTIPCASDTVFLEIDLVAYKKGLSD